MTPHEELGRFGMKVQEVTKILQVDEIVSQVPMQV